MTRLGPLLAAALACSCAEPEPDVQIKTFVGASYAQNDPELSRKAAMEVFAKALPEWWGAGKAEDDTPDLGVAETVHPPRTKKQFDDLVTAIRKGPLDELAGPARRLAAADPEVWSQVKAGLLADRKAPKGDYRSLLLAIGGDMPNRYGYFKLAWKKAHGFAVKLSQNWFEDLLALPRSKVSPGLLKVYRDCILQTALLRAAAKIGAHPPVAKDVAETLLQTAYVHQGTFRDEVSRTIAAIGDEAVPHLIELAISPSNRRRDEVKPEVKRARFAEHSLDKMDRLHPARATAAVRDDPRLLAQTLSAYGKAKPGEAAGVLLDFADDRSPLVRAAARDAFREYVHGPPPTVSARRVRLIGGGTGVALAYLSYRERARLAIRDRIETEAPALLEPPCELKRENGSMDKRCERQPARLTKAYVRWLDLRRELDETAKIDAALRDADPDAGAEALDRLLAVSPGVQQRDRIASFFARLGQAKLEAGDHQRAAALFRKASMLGREVDATHARTLHVAALHAEAELDALPRAGRLMLLRRAAELAPDDPRIAQAVQRVESEPTLLATASSLTGNKLFGAAGILAVILFTLGLLGRPLRRRLFS